MKSEPQSSRRTFLKFSAMSGLAVAAGCSRPMSDGSALVSSNPSSISDDGPLVETAAGKLRGRSADGVHIFRGIPYAAAPTGDLRFMAPRPVANWQGERDAVALGHPSLQSIEEYAPWLDPQPQSEDCLVLNIWAPDSGSAGKPVMFWIHGGGYWNGSAGASMYDGSNLARSEDVVVVGVNHRLNAFGYLWLGDIIPELSSEGNPGQRDLVAALGWVRDNIALFGGDPSNVTLFGESGGGGKVSALLATPSARGLFHRAIIQSGSALVLQNREVATETARSVLSELGGGTFDLARLQSIDAAEIKRAADVAGFDYGPVRDGDFMPHPSWEGEAPVEAAGIPLLIGSNTHELVALQPDFADPIVDDEAMEQRFRASIFSPELSSEQYRAYVEGHRALQPTADRHEILAAITSDPSFFRAARQQADLKAAQKNGDVFLYEFNWRTPCFGGQWALHAGEIPLVFGNLSYESAWDGMDNDAARTAADPDDYQSRLSSEMRSAWAAFARSGDPSTPALAWSTWDHRRETMILDGKQSQSTGGHADERFALAQELPPNPVL